MKKLIIVLMMGFTPAYVFAGGGLGKAVIKLVTKLVSGGTAAYVHSAGHSHVGPESKDTQVSSTTAQLTAGLPATSTRCGKTDRERIKVMNYLLHAYTACKRVDLPSREFCACDADTGELYKVKCPNGYFRNNTCFTTSSDHGTLTGSPLTATTLQQIISNSTYDDPPADVTL